MPRIQLTGEQEERIRNALLLLHDALPAMDAAERCGISCTEMRADAERVQQRLLAYLKEFGRGRA